MRDDKWLFAKLDQVWDKYFPEMPMDNDVHIVWGRKARQRLGSIKQGKKVLGKHPETIITINSLFKDNDIPEFVIEATIAHELAHYSHGFHSPLKKQFSKPHEGGVVHKELELRGAADLEKKSRRWLKENWRDYLNKNMPRTNISVRRKKRRVIIRWI